MKSKLPISLSRPSRKIPRQEQGISMVISLMMGMVLMAGTTGLLLRQLMARKLAASESYQQMAETAALNGFNQILGELNNDNSTTYKGYLFTLNHNIGDINNPGNEQWGWTSKNGSAFPLRELCTDRSHLPIAVQGITNPPPYTNLTEGTSSQRSDGKGDIKLQYRLRGYTTTATAKNNGLGEGRFQIEGTVIREGDDSKTGYLARTLLLRSLYVSSIVAGEGDWAVLSGPTLSLGDTEIIGDGKIILNINDTNQNGTGCDSESLLMDVKASTNNESLKNRIIPILETGLPNNNLWDLGLTQDKQSGSDKVRIWSFDDTGALTECGASACSRNSDQRTASAEGDVMENNSVIRLSAAKLCSGSGSDCHIYVEHINLTKSKLFIETNASRPVVLHLEYPGTSTVSPSESAITGSINLGKESQLCGVASGESDCNKKPEELVILSTAPKPATKRECSSINPQSNPYTLAFEGNSLPHATIHLTSGFIKTGNSSTTLNGLIWADGICTNAGPFTLVTKTQESSSVVRDLNKRWGWENKNFPGYGQMVTRGVRGTGLDTFRRW